MFRYKKYGLTAGAVSKSLETPEAGGTLDRRRSGVRVSTQALEPLAKAIDLSCSSLLRRSFPILGEFGASKRRIALQGELGDLAGRRGGIDRRRGRRRGFQTADTRVVCLLESQSAPTVARGPRRRSACGEAAAILR